MMSFLSTHRLRRESFNSITSSLREIQMHRCTATGPLQCNFVGDMRPEIENTVFEDKARLLNLAAADSTQEVGIRSYLQKCISVDLHFV
jgi:hypothetical protein